MLNTKNAKNLIDSENLSGPGFQIFLNIARLWKLSVHEQITLLGLNSNYKYYSWKKDPNPSLPTDTMLRISYILGIYKALKILLPDNSAADEWVKCLNSEPLFEGKTALGKMMSGDIQDLAFIRKYLDAQRGCWA